VEICCVICGRDETGGSRSGNRSFRWSHLHFGEFGYYMDSVQRAGPKLVVSCFICRRKDISGGLWRFVR
jgi:hypothetical protein